MLSITFHIPNSSWNQLPEHLLLFTFIADLFSEFNSTQQWRFHKNLRNNLTYHREFTDGGKFLYIIYILISIP